MEWLWNWGGECFGYRNGDDLFAYHGKKVGNRLITARSKKGWRKYSFSPSRRGGYARYAGYEDFPSTDNFR
jgi:hypothetical protein